MHHHLEPVMGTMVGITSPRPLPEDGIAAAAAVLHEADRVFSTWAPQSPMSRLRTGAIRLEGLESADAEAITAVLARCRLARELTGGAFDPWAMPGGVDPTGLVKGWAAMRARDALVAAGTADVMVNAGGDIAVAGDGPSGAWRVGIRHPAQPRSLAATIEVSGAVATSGDYERPGQLLEPSTGRASRVAASATVTGPDLDLADALATGLAVDGRNVLVAIDALDGYEAYLVLDNGRHLATPGMAFVHPRPKKASA